MKLPTPSPQYNTNDQAQTRRLIEAEDAHNVKQNGSNLIVDGPAYILPGTSVTPTKNGQIVFELTSNTVLTFHARGSDGTVRSAAITLA